MNGRTQPSRLGQLERPPQRRRRLGTVRPGVGASACRIRLSTTHRGPSAGVGCLAAAVPAGRGASDMAVVVGRRHARPAGGGPG